MNFVRFREYNDNEGESWNFWLQLDGNETELQELVTWLSTFDEAEEYYDIDMTPVPESEVDILVKHSDTGYMQYENKVTGKFVCPQPTGEDEKNGAEWLDSMFYKGGIKEYFK